MNIINNQESSELNQFNAHTFFIIKHKNKLLGTELRINGVDLVSQYYSSKYLMEKLIIISDIDDIQTSTRFIAIIKSQDFSRIRNDKNDRRIPFLIISLEHSIPAAYIKENGNESILIFDSLGDVSQAKTLAHALPEITIYTSFKKRQHDFFSCYADAMVFLRELTGKNESGQFLLTNILDTLKEHECPENIEENAPHNFHKVKLFSKLLITAQIPSFVSFHHEQYQSQAVIHKNKNIPENIKQFLERYSLEDTDTKWKKPTVSNYLQEKGLKLAHVIEIQFYLNQFQSKLGTQFDEKMKNEFVTIAKNELKKYVRICFLTENIKKNNTLNLYQKALNFLENKLAAPQEGCLSIARSNTSHFR